jgi:[2-(trimethylamino)ethyl]phosphonate dioxygenase
MTARCRTSPAGRGRMCPVGPRARRRDPAGRLHERPHRPAALAAWLAAVRRFGFALMTGICLQERALADVVALRLHPRDQLRPLVRRQGRGQPGQSRLHQSRPAGPHRQSLSRPGAHAPAADVPGKLRRGRRVDRGGRLQRGDAPQARHPDSFRLLSRYCARFEYAGSGGVRLAARRPVIELSPDGELIAMRFNNRSASAAHRCALRAHGGVLPGLRQFAADHRGPGAGGFVQAKAGRAVHRRQHPRAACAQPFAGSGSRWLQGCYADKDGLLSTLAVLEHIHEGGRRMSREDLSPKT